MAVVLASSCIDKYQSDVPHVVVNPATEVVMDFEADTLRININESRIGWIATEMRGTKRHTGIISFIDGYFLTKNNDIVGGKFKVDMETMDVTDLPLHETIARKNLLDHLKSDDFFNVAHYPLSTLEITNIQNLKSDSLKISGNLTIREISKNIEFLAYQKGNQFSTIFSFNRLDWNIAYQGSWADKTFVDKDVELNISVSID